MSKKLDAIEPVRTLLGQFSTSLADVMESMAEQRPEIEWQSASGPPSSIFSESSAGILWWEQPLQFAPHMKIWVGAPQSAWEYSGSLVLKAAGLDTVEPEEAKNTWIEVLGQALSAVARAAGRMLGFEVSCESGSEAAPPETINEWATIRAVFPERPLDPVVLAFSQAFLDVLCAPPPAPEPPPEQPSDSRPALDSGLGERSRTLDLLLDVDLPVSISFGKTLLALKDVIKLTTGSIVELNRGVNEPVEVLVNHTLVARGEVVVIDGNYGVRILEIASRNERLRSIQ